MIKFKRKGGVSGRLKNMVIDEGVMIDTDSGEQIDIIQMITDMIGPKMFDIVVTQQDEEEI